MAHVNQNNTIRGDSGINYIMTKISICYLTWEWGEDGTYL